MQCNELEHKICIMKEKVRKHFFFFVQKVNMFSEEMSKK